MQTMDVDLHQQWLDTHELPDPPAMPPIYQAAIDLAMDEIDEVSGRLIDRTGVKYTRSLEVLAHNFAVVAWCYRRLHAHRCATLQHCGPAPAPAVDDLGAVDVDDIPF